MGTEEYGLDDDDGMDDTCSGIVTPTHYFVRSTGNEGSATF